MQKEKSLYTQYIHELNQSLTVIKTYLSGCIIRLQRNELSTDQTLSTLQKINDHTEVLTRKIHFIQHCISQQDDK